MKRMALGNFFMQALITSPLYFLLGPNFAVITVTGRKTGQSISTPINVGREGQVYTVISLRERTWWRNLRGQATAQLHVGGKTYAVQGEVIETPAEVGETLRRYFQQHPQVARYFAVQIAPDGSMDNEDVQRVAAEHLVIHLRPLTG